MRRWAVLIVAGILAAALGSRSAAQLPRFPGTDKIRQKLPRIPGVDRLPGTAPEPAITTGLADAVSEVPFLDDFNPPRLAPLTDLRRTADGGFVLTHPGTYVFEAQSYCLHAGSYGPRGGDGYLYAPLKGPQSEIIRSLLVRSVARAEVPQQDIQVLIWAILSRTRITDMSPRNRATAAALLTPAEIARLDGSALELLSNELLNRTAASLPRQLQQAFRAEAQLRSLLTRGAATYQELERIAVLEGDPPQEPGGRRAPGSRWSYHPRGYFVRYIPFGYSRTRVELSVPEPFRIVRDSQGRITELRATLTGHRVELGYDDSLPPAAVGGELRLRGWALSLVRFVWAEPSGERLRVRESVWTGRGWTLAGLPAGNGRGEAMPARFSDAADRYERARIEKRQLDEFDRVFPPLAGPEDLHDLAHLKSAVAALLREDRQPLKNQTGDPVYVIQRAWQHAFLQRVRGIPAWRTSSGAAPGLTLIASLPPAAAGWLSTADPGPGGGESTSLSGDVATPASNRQRLAVSDRPAWADRPSDCTDLANMLNNAIAGAKEYHDLPEKRKNMDPNDRKRNSDDDVGLKSRYDIGVTSGTCQYAAYDNWTKQRTSFGQDADAFMQWMADHLTSTTGAPYSAADIRTIAAHEATHMQQCLSNPEQFKHDTLEDIVAKEVPGYCKEAAQAYSEYQRAGCPDPGHALEQAAAANGMSLGQLFSLCGW